MSFVRPMHARHDFSVDTLRDGPVPPLAGAGATAWPSANLAIYVPFIVPRIMVVRTLWFGAGATGTGNYDMGLYNASGAAVLRRGSTAKGTTQEEVVWDCTDTTIGPGLYYFALVASNGTDTYLAFTPSAPSPAAYGMLSEASALPLPATATFAVPQTLAFVPVGGIFLNTIVT